MEYIHIGCMVDNAELRKMFLKNHSLVSYNLAEKEKVYEES